MVDKNLFNAAFQITRTIIFEVSSYDSHFSTSAYEFVKNKKDFRRAGQAQNDLLPIGSVARKFWNKWDKKHLKDLTVSELKELQKDLDVLKKNYNYIYDKQTDRSPKWISFDRLKKLSMENLKK